MIIRRYLPREAGGVAGNCVNFAGITPAIRRVYSLRTDSGKPCRKLQSRSTRMSQRSDSNPGLEVTVSRWLLRRAASQAPSELTPRLEEEWLADLATRDSTCSRMRFICGCWWAAIVIARDLRRQAPAASPMMAA